MIINVKHADTDVDLTVNFNLTAATARVLTRPRRTDDEATELPSTIIDAASGVIRITTSGLEPGDYDLEVEVTASGRIATFPDSGYVTLRVHKDLG